MALRQDNVVEVRRFVQIHIDAYDIGIVLEDLGLLVVVAPPFDGVARVAEGDFGGLGVIQIRMRLRDVLEVVVLGKRLNFHHAHSGGGVVALVHLRVVRVGEGQQQLVIVDKPLGFPDAEAPGHVRIVVCPAVADGVESAEAAHGIRRTNEIVQRKYRLAHNLVAGKSHQAGIRFVTLGEN